MAKKIKLVKKGDTFKPSKLRASVRKAGATKNVQDEVLKSVKVRSGMSTLELRRQVTEILRRLAPKVAKKYAKHKNKK